MIMLIPFAVIVSLTAVILLTVISSDVEAEISRNELARRAITMHHEIVTRSSLPAEGIINEPSAGVFTAFSGIQSYVFTDGGNIFLATFVLDHAASADPVPEDQDRLIRSVMRNSARDIERSQEFRWEVVYGDLELESGPFPASIGSLLIPFTPPVEEGSPVILSIFSEVF